VVTDRASATGVRARLPLTVEALRDVLDPDVLTIGFARRVPSYKRLTLMLQDRARFTSMLLDAGRPVQIVIAGKAHPADDGGKRLIQEVVKFADSANVRHRMVFLPDYDMALGRVLCAGADVWLNNPLRPLEACGTSGMKAALNGVLNLSIRDGWWDEWYDGSNGWAIPSADAMPEDRRDELEAAAFYDIVETQMVPRFYDQNESGLPTRWLEMVRHTLSSLGPKVVATRMLRDYVLELYSPAAQSYRPARARPPPERGCRCRRRASSSDRSPHDAAAAGTHERSGNPRPRRGVRTGATVPTPHSGRR